MMNTHHSIMRHHTNKRHTSDASTQHNNPAVCTLTLRQNHCIAIIMLVVLYQLMTFYCYSTRPADIIAAANDNPHAAAAADNIQQQQQQNRRGDPPTTTRPRHRSPRQQQPKRKRQNPLRDKLRAPSSEGAVQAGGALPPIPTGGEHPACQRLRASRDGSIMPPVRFEGALLFFCPAFRTEADDQLADTFGSQDYEPQSIRIDVRNGPARQDKASVTYNVRVPRVPDAELARIWNRAVQVVAEGEDDAVRLLVDTLATAWPFDNGLWPVQARHRWNFNNGYLLLWGPPDDEGAQFVIFETEKHNYAIEERTFEPGEVVVDIGSNLGIVTLRVAFQQPHAKIVAIEASPYTWILQQVSLWSNLGPDIMGRGDIHALVGALAARDGGYVPMQFRGGSTTSTRSWNPQSEASRTTNEIRVPTISFQTMMKSTIGQAPDHGSELRIPWMKVDCEGCEYSFMPTLSEQWVQNNVDHMDGELHYHFMSSVDGGAHKPPLDKVKATHKRICPKYPADRQQSICSPGWYNDPYST